MGRSARRSAATIPDVARAAGVSRATAARALGGYGAVSEQVKQRVLAAAQELGYRPNALARSMITGRTRALGVAIANIEDPFFARLTRGVTDVARAEGFEVLVANTDEDPSLERQALRVFGEQRVEGILLTPAPTAQTDHLTATRQQGTPIVFMDRHVKGVDIDAVVVDNHDATRRAVDHLLDAGHTRIALVAGGGPSDQSGNTDQPAQTPPGLGLATTTLDRIDGFHAALAARGLRADQRYLRCGDFHRESARAEALHLLGVREPPTAIFAAGSIVALGVLEAIRETRRRIPDDISLVTFDDADWSAVVEPALTSIAQPVNEIGALATRTLLKRIRGDDSPAGIQVLGTEFHRRHSVAPPHA